MTISLTRRAIGTSVTYYLSRARRIKEISPPLEAVAVRTVNICRPEIIGAVRPFFKEEQTSRIADTEWYTAHQIVQEHLNRQVVVLRPLQVHEFRNAYLVDGSVYLGDAMRIELRSELMRSSLWRRFSVLPVAPKFEFSEAALVASVAGSTWFGHWLEDELPLQMLSAHFAPPIAHTRPEYRDEPYYRNLLNLENPKRVGTAFVSRLTIIDEFAQNPSKTRRYWRIRKQLAGRPKGADRVFLNRGGSGTARSLRNEKELLDRFYAEGYSIVEIGTSSLPELLRVLNGASLVVSVEGSHLAHALYAMAEFGTMVVLNPPERAYTTVADIAPFCKLHASMFICSPNEDGSFSADVDELLEFVEDAISDSKARRGELEHFIDLLRRCPVGDLGYGRS
jgi:capsular polysaccharide biosynthesis protein